MVVLEQFSNWCFRLQCCGDAQAVNRSYSSYSSNKTSESVHLWWINGACTEQGGGSCGWEGKWKGNREQRGGRGKGNFLNFFKRKYF